MARNRLIKHEWRRADKIRDRPCFQVLLPNHSGSFGPKWRYLASTPDLTQLKNWVEIWGIECGLDDCHSAINFEILDDEAMMAICLSLFLVNVRSFSCTSVQHV